MVLSGTAVFADSGEFENKLSAGTIKSLKVLERNLELCDSKEEALSVFERTDAQIVASFYQKTTFETIELIEQIPDDICYYSREKVEEIAANIEGVKSIDVHAYEFCNDIVTVEEVYLDDGTKFTTTMIDGPENNTVMENIPIGEVLPLQGATGLVKQMRKDFGDRYTQINCKCEYALYPDTYLKTRLGYTVKSNKMILGWYIKGYPDSAANIANEVENTPTDYKWIKKAENAKYVAAKQNFDGKFSIKGIPVLTYAYTVTMTAEPTSWGNGYALMKVTAEVATKLKS